MTTADFDGLVDRALARDTMLTMAHDAEEVMLVVHRRDSAVTVAGDTGHEDLFALAVARLLRQATSAGPDRDWALRSQGYAHAATVLRFADHMGPGRSESDPGDLYRSALAELRPDGPDGFALDPMNEVLFTYRHIRGLRASGQTGEALRLAAELSPKFFNASGAEPRRADVQFEIGACLLAKGQAGQVFRALGELEEEYWRKPETEVFSTRHRYDYILGLAEQARGRTEEAATRLEAALDHLRMYRLSDTWHDVYELSLTLTLAEIEAVLVLEGRRAADPVGRAEAALRLSERIQGRWGVIARTQTPLSAAFRRIYGDIALMVAGLTSGPAEARLGLRVCLSAKQTGFAGHLRSGESLLPRAIAGLVHELLSAEQDPPPELGALPEIIGAWKAQRAERLTALHKRIKSRVNPVLADMLLPVPADIDALIRTLRHRSALDFTGLPDSLGDGPNWFRTLIDPSGTVTFESFDPTGAIKAHATAAASGDYDEAPWDRMARALLPGTLRQLVEIPGDEPPGIVISAHRELSLMPWAALLVEDGTRLVRCALLTHTPVLTCLAADPLPAVTGPALVRLVSQDETGGAPGESGVYTLHEQQAWGLADHDGRIALSRCTLDGQPPRAAGSGQLSVALGQDGWGFVHIATHGHGTGLEQCLWIPEETGVGGLLSAAQALGLRWPASTLMASCDIGKLLNAEDAEPLGFVMAVLTGGGRCVVAAVDHVRNKQAGELAAHIVTLIRGGGVRLDQALRSAQLAFEEDEHEPVGAWALFNAYLR
ncbi:CHAT domain-containing protein [Actinoplanes sp. ATCC 53533]|uniref:CHAT domain-containing protein n=1 Tax=Actinoplanes sp. ATCC 53533 TaxID=1288362 RepID=UPI000F782ECD|nr:CHAT domain-containing protein [Actinoplanes sp. ATCC 53533]